MRCNTRSTKITFHFPLSQRAKSHGFTLIEFMVASTLAIVVLLAIGITYSITSNMRNASEYRLAAQQDLRNTSELILRDAQMAGSFGCFNMGNLLAKQMPASPGSNNGFQSNTENLKLILNDPNYSGISIISDNAAKHALQIAGFTPASGSSVLVFTYGLHVTPVTGSANPVAHDVPRELKAVADAGGPIALSSCSRMFIGKGNALGKNGNDLVINNSFGGGSLTPNFSREDVFYIPQTTLSQVYSVAYAVGRIPNVNSSSNALYRFSLNPNGKWGNPQLMVSNIQSMQINQLYAGCSDNSTEITFADNRTILGAQSNITRISMLPTIIEVRLQLNTNSGSAQTYGTVNQYLIRANVRGGNVCANHS